MTSLFSFITAHKDQISQFDTPQFIFFLIFGVFFYYILRRPKILLFILSYLFYASFSVELSVFVLLLSTINFYLGKALDKYHSRILLTGVILLNLSALVYFKYFNFILLNLFKLKMIAAYNPLSNIVLPLGISFFVFEFLHYIVDIYRRNKPVDHLIDFYIFSFFFPTQIAGPIKRYEHFIPQLRKKRIDFALIASGVDLIILGLFKKLVLADALSFFTIRYFTEAYSLNNVFTFLLGIYAFCFQIYFDFSGYSDIGRGAAALLNIRVPINFANPYLSTSIPEFWRRWHITLMDWLRDYIYIPLGGSRKGKVRRALNIVIVFVVSGLWHGAAYHFVAWGLYNAILMLIAVFLKPSRLIRFLPKKIIGVICWLVTFNLIAFGWILFRAQSLYDVNMILRKMLTTTAVVIINRDILFIVILLCLYNIAGPLFAYIKPHRNFYLFTKYSVYAITIILIVVSININKIPFIYFQF